MSGASFNSSFEVAPMREPIQKNKGEINNSPCPNCFNIIIFLADSILSAEAPEFVPRLSNMVSPHAAPTSHQRNQQAGPILNHNVYRNHGPPHHYSVTY